ncbi:MAG: hypothetical protein K5765_05275 [Clostridia bacterium]|nr:hypothetical protein [Clostridia bacterium]
MISVAVQRGSFVYVYDEKNHVVFTTSGKLYGYTSSTVSVLKDGKYIYTYDDRHKLISTKFVG